MAIQFARIRIIGRKTGGNSCRSSAYNARSRIKDNNTGEVFNFSNRKDNVYHEVLLPKGVDEKFKNISILSNAVEAIEKKSNSQLLKEVVIALPDDKEFSLQDRINLTHLMIKEMNWVENGLAVQMDIHKPDEEDKNWHAHLLVQTRRFKKCGTELGEKARDLNPVFKTSKGKSFIVPEEDIIHRKWKVIINDYCRHMGYKTRVNLIGKVAQEHLGPVRMRNVMNDAVYRNEIRKEENIKYLKSGAKLLEHVTHHMSVFNRDDLVRAVRIIPKESTRVKLVEEALAHKSIVQLYSEDGDKMLYFTTVAIRKEENKIVRLSQYVANKSNVFDKAFGGKESKLNKHLVDINRKAELSGEPGVVLTEEQRDALSDLILSDCGIRILRGRAGAGKSLVLKQIPIIAQKFGINVIGLAPTHKAKLELASDGFGNTDTIKAMLFKLINGRFHLAKGSLIVVDEAGMIGNDDYKELLRVAASRKCNVILAGDEKQLASVQRGGMFEVLSERYGSSTILNIQRQKNQWGRDVAMAFSNGEVRSGISILQQHNKIVESLNPDESLLKLLEDWSQSKESIADRLIIAVTNRDVNALNHGARQYLKCSGDLWGEEFSVAGNHYMKGDRIMIKKTNKKLGLVNGDLATVIHASKEQFIISMEVKKGSKNGETNENKKLVEFNPSEFSDFRHGYATTIFKAQCATILAVFVLHNGFAGIRNSYVALSRNVVELKLYINSLVTKSLDHLSVQLGRDPEAGSSLSYLTEEEVNKAKLSGTEKEQGVLGSILSKALDFTKNKVTAFNDKHFLDNSYYNYKEPDIKRVRVEHVLDIVSAGEKVVQTAEAAKLVVGGNQIRSSTSNSILSSGKLNAEVGISKLTNFLKVNLSAKERFYKKADYSSNHVKIAEEQQHQEPDITQATAEERLSNSLSVGEKVVHTEEAEKLVVGDNQTTSPTAVNEKLNAEVGISKVSNSPKVNLSAKERFYKQADYSRKQVAILERKQQWEMDSERLKSEVKYKAEKIAINLLGAPNKGLSSGSTLRFGEKGKIVVQTSGGRIGTWYDFSSNQGGDMFALVQHQQSCDFKEAAEYLRSMVGMASSADQNEYLKLVHEDRNKALAQQQIQARKKEEQRAAVIDRLFKRAQNIDKNSIVQKYLTNHRCIDPSINLGVDIKIANIFVASEEKGKKGKKGKYFPALIAFAKDKDGKVTGVQQIVLDPITAIKADIAIPKKSLGTISGSFVNVSDISNADKQNKQSTKLGHGQERITVIAEGLETALSVKQALANDANNKEIQVKVLCSLGISNIRNYNPTKGEKIIIAADNDGPNSNTNQTVEKAKVNLIEKGAFVEIVRPNIEGDFNDVLKAGNGKDISKAFTPSITRHTATTLEVYLSCNDENQTISLDNNDRTYLAYIQKYQMPELSLINAYRKGKLCGRIELQTLRKNVEFATNHFKDNQSIFAKAKEWGYEEDTITSIKSMVGMNEKQANQYAIGIREKYHQQHIDTIVAEIRQKRLGSNSIEGILSLINREQTILKLKSSELVDIKSLEQKCEFLIKNKIQSKVDIIKAMQEAGDLKSTAQDFFNKGQDFANKIIRADSILIESYDKAHDEKGAIKLLLSRKEDYKEYASYVENSPGIVNFTYLNNRLETSVIFEKHKLNNPVLAEQFKLEMQALSRFCRGKMSDVIENYQEKGLDSAMRYAQRTNSTSVLKCLEHRTNILNSEVSLLGSDYVKAIAKDKEIMRYVDHAIENRKSFSNQASNAYTLEDYAYHRNIEMSKENNKKMDFER